MKNSVFLFALLLFCISCNSQNTTNKTSTTTKKTDTTMENNPTPVVKTEAEWRQLLSPEVFEISRNKGTERPFTGQYNNHFDTGVYHCIACNNPLFKSNAKFESSCGWPSFFEPVTKGSIIYTPDNTHGMQRTEVTCGQCKGHLGHVFEDGPPPTGLRYCINSVILKFAPKK
jgi:peptide-methionine (R)-S-oxide reductase